MLDKEMLRLEDSDDSWRCWGCGQGLAKFSDATTEVALRRHVTVALWQEFLLEGAVGTPSLMATHGSRAPTFVDSSRRAVLMELAPRLTSLDNGELSGQANCFVLLGLRGVGKSHFILSLVHMVARVAKPSTCVVYVNFKDSGVQSLFGAIRVALSDKKLVPAVAAAEASAAVELDQFLLSKGLRVFLVVDELEQLYCREKDDVLAKTVWQELHFIGERKKRRSIMAVITGSTPVLRALVFAQPEIAAARIYPGYTHLGSLNNRKYLPLMLKPLTEVSDVRRAMLCVASGDAWQRVAIEMGMLCVPDEHAGHEGGGAPAEHEGFGAPAEHEGGGAPAETLSAGFTVEDDAVEFVQARTRGLMSWMQLAMTGVDETERPFFLHLRDAAKRAPLARLFSAWETHVGGTQRAVDVAAGMSSTICDFKLVIPADEDATDWYKLMDEGVVCAEGGVAAGTTSVSFLHPSDAASCLLAFSRDHGAGTLSAAEQIALMFPQLASSDEINERLAMESLAWKSREPGGLVLRGRTIRNLVARNEHLLVSGDGVIIGPHHIFLGVLQSNTLYKEFPDMFGADGIALVQAPGEKPAALRAQVKFATEKSATTISGPLATRWLDHMTRHSESICTQLAATLGPGATVESLLVFWTGQKPSGPADAIFRERCDLYVRAENMRDFWSPRIRNFVDAKELKKCGWKA